MFVVMLLWLATGLAGTASWPLISGPLAGGKKLMFFTEPPMHIEVWSQRNGRHIVSRLTPEPLCTVDHYYSDRMGETAILKCSADNNSLLAGIEFIGRRPSRLCRNGGPDLLFTCIEGCRPGLPRNLRQEYWECPEGE
jgi:hypothetical protein